MQRFSETDIKGFANELRLLRIEIEAKIGREDFVHLRKIELWGRICTLIGYATSWIFPNPLSAILISQGNMVRWAIMMHHVGHKGYDKVPCPERYKSYNFAKGARRFIDWCDWMYPPAWNYEHNILHHYHTGETTDPDLAERNVERIRNSKLPMFLKYLAVFLFMCTWKFTYYAPKTFWIYYQKKESRKQKNNRNNSRSKQSEQEDYSGARLFIPNSKASVAFWFYCLLPYVFIRFILIPALFFPLGIKACIFVLINSFIAEIITNIYSFIIIVPNHAGDDLYRFENGVDNSSEFFVRQVVGSVNYNCGNDRLDFMHGWLNYQIEHHLFPHLPLLKYQQYQPRIKVICEKYKVPYIQQSVFKRFGKLTDILVGKTTMKKMENLILVTEENSEVKFNEAIIA